MKRISNILCLLILSIAIFTLVACSGGTFDIVGAWSDEGDVAHYIFNEDGTYLFVNQVTEAKGTYTVDAEEVFLTDSDGSESNGKYDEGALLFDNILGRFSPSDFEYAEDESSNTNTADDSNDVDNPSNDDSNDVDNPNNDDDDDSDSKFLSETYYYNNQVYYDLHEDGTYLLVALERETTGTYTIDGDTIYFTADNGDTSYVTYDSSENSLLADDLGYFTLDGHKLIQASGEGEEVLDGIWYFDSEVYYEFYEDGTYRLTVMDRETTGTYSFDGVTVYFTADNGDTSHVTYDSSDNSFLADDLGYFTTDGNKLIPPSGEGEDVTPSSFDDMVKNGIFEGVWTIDDIMLILYADGTFILEDSDMRHNGYYTFDNPDFELASEGGNTYAANFDITDNSIYSVYHSMWLFYDSSLSNVGGENLYTETGGELIGTWSNGEVRYMLYTDGIYSVASNMNEIMEQGTYSINGEVIYFDGDRGSYEGEYSINSDSFYLNNINSWLTPEGDMNTSESASVFGKWTTEEERPVLSLFEDGTYYYDVESRFDNFGTYEIVDGDVTFYETTGEIVTGEYSSVANTFDIFGYNQDYVFTYIGEPTATDAEMASGAGFDRMYIDEIFLNYEDNIEITFDENGNYSMSYPNASDSGTYEILGTWILKMYSASGEVYVGEYSEYYKQIEIVGYEDTFHEQE